MSKEECPPYEGGCPFRAGGKYTFRGNTITFVEIQYGDAYTTYAFTDEQGNSVDLFVYDYPHADSINLADITPEINPAIDALPSSIQTHVHQLLYGSAAERAAAAFHLGEMGVSAQPAVPYLTELAADDVRITYGAITTTPRQVAQEALTKILH